MNRLNSSSASPGASPADGFSQAPPAPSRGIKPLVSLRAHKTLAIALAASVALLGLPMAWLKGKPAYYAEAVIYVSPQFVKNLDRDKELEFQSNSQYRQYVQQQVRTINRKDIMQNALERLGEKQSLWRGEGEPIENAAKRLQAALIIRPVRDTYLITVGLEGGKPDGLADIVNAVVIAYLARQRDEAFYANDERIQNLKTEGERLLKQIQENADRRTQIAQEIGVTVFSEGFRNPYDELLINGREALSAARRSRIQAEARLAALDGKPQGEAGSALDAMARERVDRDEGFNSLKANLNLRRSLLLAKMSGLTEQHPGRRAILRELKDIDDELTRFSEGLMASFRSSILAQRKAGVFEARRIESELMKEEENQSQQASWFASRYHEAIGLGADLDRTRRRLGAIEDRIDFLTLESGAPGFVRVDSRAIPPPGPYKGGRKRFFVLFLVAALGLGLVAPVAVDMLDPRIHTANDVDRTVGFSPVGWMLERWDEPTETFAQDQLMRLVARIDRERRARGAGVFMLTSVKPGGGTSTLALDLARELAGIGIPALALEANAFKPDKRYSGGPAGKGLIDMLNGNPSLQEAIVQGGEGMPDRMPVGATGGRRHLASLQKLGSLLEKLHANYPIVLVDAPPLLLSADTELLAGIVDATLLVVEADGVNKGEVKRAARSLERLDPPAAGVILNRVRIYEGGGYFANLLREYQTGEKPPVSKWASPWLWK